MSKILIFIAAVFVASAYSNEMSEADRKLLTGTLYLSHCVYHTSDFREAVERMDQRYIKAYDSNVEGRLDYVDGWAVTKISLSKDLCVVKIGSSELDKLASSLKSILEVSGGKLELKPVKNRYEGTLKIGKEIFVVKAFHHPKLTDFINAGIFRSK